MARRSRDPVADEVRKKRTRQLKGKERREKKRDQRNEEASSGPLDVSWLRDIKTMGHAEKIISRSRQRPYWLSIAHEAGDGNAPVANVHPCTMFRTKERVYYGFLFRDHRERVFYAFTDARRELTSVMYDLAPQLMA